MNKNKISKSKQTGFTLIEILVTILIFSIGLLGLAALQSTALKSNHSAYQRSQAIFLAYDMIDRMRANKNMAIAGNYDIALGANPPGADLTDLSVTDLRDWLNNFVEVLLPSGQGSIACQSPAANVGICTVVLSWDESRVGGSATGQNDDPTTFTLTSQI